MFDLKKSYLIRKRKAPIKNLLSIDFIDISYLTVI